jgi:hypothetical protein
LKAEEEGMAMAEDHASEKQRGEVEVLQSEEQECPDLKRPWQEFD